MPLVPSYPSDAFIWLEVSVFLDRLVIVPGCICGACSLTRVKLHVLSVGVNPRNLARRLWHEAFAVIHDICLSPYACQRRRRSAYE